MLDLTQTFPLSEQSLSLFLGPQSVHSSITESVFNHEQLAFSSAPLQKLLFGSKFYQESTVRVIDLTRVMGFCPYSSCYMKIPPGKGLRVVSTSVSVSIFVSLFSNISQLPAKSQFPADPVKALPFFFCLRSWGFPEFSCRAFFPSAVVGLHFRSYCTCYQIVKKDLQVRLEALARAG